MTADAIQPRLRGYAAREQQDAEARDDRQSPHYLGFLKPFLQHLQAVKRTPATARKPQAGDAELAQLAAGFGYSGNCRLKIGNCKLLIERSL